MSDPYMPLQAQAGHYSHFCVHAPHTSHSQGCLSDQFIDAACLGGPKVATVATLTSVSPATPYLFTNYELVGAQLQTYA